MAGVPPSSPGSSASPASYLPGTASLLEELDKRLLVVLRDGRTLIGVLRSVDQFANLVLHRCIERIPVGTDYGDIPRGIFVVRGENVVSIVMASKRSTQPLWTFPFFAGSSGRDRLVEGGLLLAVRGGLGADLGGAGGAASRAGGKGAAEEQGLEGTGRGRHQRDRLRGQLLNNEAVRIANL